MPPVCDLIRSRFEVSGASCALRRKCAAPMVENLATECERSAVVLSTLSNGAVSAPVIGLGPERNVPIKAPTDWPPADLKHATRGRRYFRARRTDEALVATKFSGQPSADRDRGGPRLGLDELAASGWR